MELTQELQALEKNIKSDNKELIEKSIEALAIDQKLKDSSDEVKALVKDLISQAEEKLTKNFDVVVTKLNEKKSQDLQGKTFTEKIKESIEANFSEIKEVRAGKSVQIKAVADMLTTGDHVTGDYIRDYNRTVITLPGQALNVADLIPSVSIDGGTYTYIRETAGEGAFAYQVEGSAKAALDFNFSHIDVTTDFLAGITAYSKKMRNNLQYLQSFLPDALRKKYFMAENADFYTKITAQATASTKLIANFDNIAEKLTSELATLEAANYNGANGIVVNIADFYKLLEIEKSTGAGYGLPIGYTYEGGVLRAFGIPVFKAPWVAANKYLVGDWSMIEKVVTEGLSLQFSDQERFSQNEIIARLEAQVNVAVKQPASIIFGDFTV